MVPVYFFHGDSSPGHSMPSYKDAVARLGGAIDARFARDPRGEGGGEGGG